MYLLVPSILATSIGLISLFNFNRRATSSSVDSVCGGCCQTTARLSVGNENRIINKKHILVQIMFTSFGPHASTVVPARLPGAGKSAYHFNGFFHYC